MHPKPQGAWAAGPPSGLLRPVYAEKLADCHVQASETGLFRDKTKSGSLLAKGPSRGNFAKASPQKVHVQDSDLRKKNQTGSNDFPAIISTYACEKERPKDPSPLKQQPSESSTIAEKETEEPRSTFPQVAPLPDALTMAIESQLERLNLARLLNPILRWCEEMGAATLDEVMDCIPELAVALALPHSDVVALEACRTPLADPALATRAMVVSRVRLETVCLGKASFAGHRAATTSAGKELSSRGGGGGERCSMPALALGVGNSGRSALLDNDWPAPMPRERQGMKKKKEKLQRMSSAMAEVSPCDSVRRFTSFSNSVDIEKEVALRLAAEEALEQQIRMEKEAILSAALNRLSEALSNEDHEKLSAAILEGQALGNSSPQLHEMLGRARQAQERLLRRHRQRCDEVLCALQASLEAPLNDAFGDMIREVLELKSFAEQAEGGAEVVKVAEIALRIWDEIQMALQLATRRGNVELLELALAEANVAGVSPQSTRVIEAQRKLQTSRTSTTS